MYLSCKTTVSSGFLQPLYLPMNDPWIACLHLIMKICPFHLCNFLSRTGILNIMMTDKSLLECAGTGRTIIL